MRTGADSLVQAAAAAGVEVCFANPGTTEMPLVLALERATRLRTVLGLFEGVCTGAADGWARMRSRPAATLLHLGPGLANGLANLHNARRARTPVVNWIGEHPARHLPFDAPLTSDIAALAGWAGWVRTVNSAREMAAASLAAVQAAVGPPGRAASLIIPADCQWEPAGEEPAVAVPEGRWCPPVSATAVAEAAGLLRRGGGALLLGSDALGERGLRAAARVAAATGCGVWVESFPSRWERGRHLPAFSTLPYFPDQARAALAGVTSLVLAGAREPVAFFAYPDQPSPFAPPGATVLALADPDVGEDAALVLEALAEELGAPATLAPRVPVSGLPEPTSAAPAAGMAPARQPHFEPTGRPLDPDVLGRAMAALAPEGAIVVNEAATTGFVWSAQHAAAAEPHTMLGLTGGSIGQGLPNALGAALACPDRRVIAFQADGSALYTVQALWSMARESVDVTVVVCANRRYRILQVELARAGVEEPGPVARDVTDLTRPVVDWTALAQGFGVPACRAETDLKLDEALRRSLTDPGPRLIEAVLG